MTLQTVIFVNASMGAALVAVIVMLHAYHGIHKGRHHDRAIHQWSLDGLPAGVSETSAIWNRTEMEISSH